MDESGINLEFDLAEYLDGDNIDYEHYFEKSEEMLFPPDRPYYEIKSKTVDASR